MVIFADLLPVSNAFLLARQSFFLFLFKSNALIIRFLLFLCPLVDVTPVQNSSMLNFCSLLCVRSC